MMVPGCAFTGRHPSHLENADLLVHVVQVILLKTVNMVMIVGNITVNLMDTTVPQVVEMKLN